MVRDVLIFHGTAGNPNRNWFPWLKDKLEEKGYRVAVPKFPTPEGESLTSWLKVLQNYNKLIGEETIIIGHSKGGLFGLRVFEKLQKPVYATFLVSAPVGIKPILYYKEDAAFSNGFEFDWDTIQNNSKHFTVYHSDTDPYVCLDNGKELAKKLGVTLQFIPNAGHLNAKSGYIKFDRLLKDIEAVL